MPIGSSSEEYIAKCKLIFPDYDYSETVYTGWQQKVIIGCPLHGKFTQYARKFLRDKTGCVICNDPARLDTPRLIKKCKETHGDKFDYSKTVFNGSNKKITICCKLHGEFTSSITNHISGAGCPECKKITIGKLKRKTNEEFIKELIDIFGDKYDLSSVDYRTTKDKVFLKCKEHGIFEIEAGSLIQRKIGCPHCGNMRKGSNKRITQEQFIEKAKIIHGDKYDYSLVNYIRSTDKVKIICRKHNVPFMMKPNGLLNGKGCPICKESKGESAIRDYLQKNNIEFEAQKRFPTCKYKNILSFDFYLPKFKLLIEFDGIQHYPEECVKFKHIGNFKNIIAGIQIRDKIKTDWCKENGYDLLRIKYDENIGIKLNDTLDEKTILDGLVIE